MNTIYVLKKCIQIDFSEYTLFLNTLVKFEFSMSGKGIFGENVRR